MEGNRKLKKTRGGKQQLTLDMIKDLGGTKEDVQLLADIEDKSDSDVDYADDFDAEPIKKDEIKNLIQELEIFKYRPSEEKLDKKEKKGKKEKDKTVNEADNLEVAVKEEAKQPIQDEQKPQVKKKERNKYKTKSLQHAEVSSTTRDPVAEYRAHIRTQQPRKYLLVKAGGDFFDQPVDERNDGEKMTDNMMEQMEQFAAKLLQDEIVVYNRQKESAKQSNVGWMKTVLSSGTLADKIAALTVLIQESPLHNLTHLDTLISMVRKKGKRASIQALDSLKELFQSELLPGDRKLKPFSQRPLYQLGESVGWNKDTLDKKLLLWYFEHKLKEKYADFVKALQEMSHDALIASKQKAVNTIYHLLVEKPEQEKELLMLLINKVGDPNHKLASTVSYFLTKLVENHPNMKGVVVREVEQLLFRPNISDRAQYYSVCFLNQLKMSHQQPELSLKIIKIYFAFFKSFVKKGEVDSKMMSALLSGVNRAYPYTKLDENFLQEHMGHLYKIVHIVNFSTSVQALMLLYQVMDSSHSTSERYYTALYRKLSDPALRTSSKQALFLNLLFKSMKSDESERRVKAFVKRILQVCSSQQPPFICGALILISEVLKLKPGLLLLSHVEEEQDSDEEEHFVDIADPEDEATTPVTPGEEEEDEDVKPFQKSHSSWIHRKIASNHSETGRYNPYHRNPQYCHADNECFWELLGLVQHFHPSVSLFARQILQGENVSYSGDPLQDFSLIRFLDRFVYKNPKKQETGVDNKSTLSHAKYVPQGVKSIPVNTDQFLQLGEENVPVDDIFYHRYFQQKAERDRKVKDEDSDAESVSDTEFDDYLDKYEGQVDGRDLAGLDFASEFSKKKDKRGQDSSDEDDDFDDADDDDDLDLSDEEIDFEDDELAKAFKAELVGLSDEDEDDEGEEDMEDMPFDEEDVEFSDDEDEFADLNPQKKSKKRKDPSSDMVTFSKKPRKSQGSAGLFAAAEEFATVIDDNVGSKIDTTGADALENKDKAHVKQLKWEVERDRWLKGSDWKSRKGGKFSKGKGKPGGGKNRKFKDSGKRTSFKQKHGKRK